jgi:hypothetical protein
MRHGAEQVFMCCSKRTCDLDTITCCNLVLAAETAEGTKHKRIEIKKRKNLRKF